MEKSDILLRINKLMEYFNLESGQFADKIEMDRSNFSKLFNTDKAIGDGIITKIAYNLNIDKEWLRSGNGSMLKEQPIIQDKLTLPELILIPLLPISAQGGSLNDFLVSVKDGDCERIISPIRGADFAITVAGDSMAPEFSNGSQVLIKRINEKAFIEWGKVFVVDTCNGTIIKKLVPSTKEGCVRCVSINPDPGFAPFDICTKDIFGIYRVMLCMSIK